MKQERRKHKRYEIGNAISINPEGIFQIVDISKGGFRFKCHPHTVVPETWVADIINSIVPLEQYLIKKVWVAVNENGSCNIPSLMWVGAKFEKLKNEQKYKLGQLMQNMSLNQELEDQDIL